MALVLAPEPPLAGWLAEFDALIQRSPGFFGARPVVLDVSALPLRKPDFTALLADLQARGMRIIWVEGADPSWLDAGLPPLMGAGRPAGASETPEAGSPESAPNAAPSPQVKTLLLDSPVRSGQSVMFPDGDVTVVGSVASGAEIIAGGSIHVYGALRGRAIAGSTGNPKARIFCRSLEAELLAIDGLYKTADDMDAQYRSRPVQAWLSGDAILMAALN
jgi:septum site-determining protein MinC